MKLRFWLWFGYNFYKYVKTPVDKAVNWIGAKQWELHKREIGTRKEHRDTQDIGG